MAWRVTSGAPSGLRSEALAAFQLEADLGQAMNQQEDHVLILDLGPADDVTPRVKSLGKKFAPVQRQAVIV